MCGGGGGGCIACAGHIIGWRQARCGIEAAGAEMGKGKRAGSSGGHSVRAYQGAREGREWGGGGEACDSTDPGVSIVRDSVAERGILRRRNAVQGWPTRYNSG